MAGRGRAAAKARRTAIEEGGTHTLRWEHLTPQEQDQALRLHSEKTMNMRQHLFSAAEGVDKTDPAKAARLRKAASHPALKEGPVDLDEMAGHLADTMTRAATGQERREDETMSGIGFYFGHRHRLADPMYRPPTAHQAQNAAYAGALMSNQLKPEPEAQAASALVEAHEIGGVHFSPELVGRMKEGYDVEGGGKRKTRVTYDASHLEGQTVPFKHLEPKLANFIRHKGLDDVAEKNSYGIDYGSIRKVGMGAGFMKAHRMLQGDPTQRPDPFENPKRKGYSESTISARPEHEEAYMRRAHYIAQVMRGEREPHSYDPAHLEEESHMPILSPSHAIAADMHHRAVTSGQPDEAASAVAGIFVPNKNAPSQLSSTGQAIGPREPIAHGDTTVTKMSLEHALQQEVTERAGRIIEKKTGVPTPAVLMQETSWAQRRRRIGGDSEFNDYRKLNPNQFQ